VSAARLARLLFAILLAACAARAEGDRLPLWVVEGEANRVYLLGSVHLLRESDYPLPAGIDAAYADAERLVMELDMDDLEPSEAAGLMAELGILGEGGSLRALLGELLYARALELADTGGIPLAMLADRELWLAALAVEQVALERLGYEPALGLEAHLAARADRDGKPIAGLETLREQLGMLDALPVPVQRTLFMETLEESATLDETMDVLLAAWRSGDMETIERRMLEDLRAEPLLYDVLIATRNRDWAARILRLLDETDDVLVVVGAAHLAGEDGLPALLAAEGVALRQLAVQVPESVTDAG